jgi:hypothetical protein
MLFLGDSVDDDDDDGGDNNNNNDNDAANLKNKLRFTRRSRWVDVARCGAASAARPPTAPARFLCTLAPPDCPHPARPTPHPARAGNRRDGSIRDAMRWPLESHCPSPTACQ